MSHYIHFFYILHNVERKSEIPSTHYTTQQTLPSRLHSLKNETKKFSPSHYNIGKNHDWYVWLCHVIKHGFVSLHAWRVHWYVEIQRVSLRELYCWHVKAEFEMDLWDGGKRFKKMTMNEYLSTWLELANGHRYHCSGALRHDIDTLWLCSHSI